MKTKLLSALSLMLLLTACSESDENDTVGGNGDVSSTLHLSFKTPDWEEFINCEKLDLYGYPVNETTNSVSATSASTKESFYFSIPKDSSAMVESGNLKKYAITEYGQNENPFEFSQKLPVTKGASTYLVSSAGSSDDSYNEVVAIEYAGNDGSNALFKVKCRYKMQAAELGNEANIKAISGTFNFKVRTSRD